MRTSLSARSLGPVMVLAHVQAHRLHVDALAVHLFDAGIDTCQPRKVPGVHDAHQVLRLGAILDQRPVVAHETVSMEIDGERFLAADGRYSPRWLRRRAHARGQRAAAEQRSRGRRLQKLSSIHR